MNEILVLKLDNPEHDSKASHVPESSTMIFVSSTRTTMTGNETPDSRQMKHSTHTAYGTECALRDMNVSLFSARCADLSSTKCINGDTTGY